MEQEKNNNGLITILISIIIVLLVLCILFTTGIINLKTKEIVNNNTNQSDTNNNENSNIDDKNSTNISNQISVSSFLISDKLISTSDVVSAHMPDGYVFLNNGKFSYYNSSFYYGISSEEYGNEKIEYNRTISSVGTWLIDNNKLILKIAKEEYAVGGETSPGPPYPILIGYTKEIKDTNKIIEYTINGINNTDENIPFLSLSSDDGEIKWYSLSVGEYLNIPKKLAENGYSDNTKIIQVNYDNKVEDNFGSAQLERKFNFKIVNKTLVITDINNNSLKMEDIYNVKSILLLSPTSADNIRLFILTTTGKLYVIENIYNKKTVNDFKNYEEIKFNAEINEIGYTKDYISPPVSTFLVIKSNNKEYLFYDTSYDKYVEINTINN